MPTKVPPGGTVIDPVARARRGHCARVALLAQCAGQVVECAVDDSVERPATPLFTGKQAGVDELLQMVRDRGLRLVDGLLLIDPAGIGMGLQAELQTPTAALVEAVQRQLRTSTPGFIEALQRSAEHDDYWLHDHLAVQLHKLIYTAWFLAEGHYPPFPKHLPQWTSRFDMDAHIREAEQRSRLESDRTRKGTALAELASAVLELNH